MVKIEKMDDGFLYLCTKTGIFRKYARHKEKPRNRFLVQRGFSVAFSKGKRKIYNRGKVCVGNLEVRAPEDLIGKKIRFKVEVLNDEGVWE